MQSSIGVGGSAAAGHGLEEVPLVRLSWAGRVSCATAPLHVLAPRRTLQASAFGKNSWGYSCPYEALGVDPGADESSIKRAYRLKCKQFHPDLNKNDNAEMKFISIGQAYELLVNRSRGKDSEDGSMTNGNSSAFHDWYWTFRMSRTWDKQQRGGAGTAGAAASFASQPESKEELRGQIAGLRHRAALRKQKNVASPGICTNVQEPICCERQQQRQQQQQQQQQQQEEDALHFTVEGPSDSGDPMPSAQAQQGPNQQQRFLGSFQARREHLSSQLTGMRKKAHLKQRMQGAQV